MAKQRQVRRVVLRFKIGAPPDVRLAAKNRTAMLPDTYYAQRSAQARAASFSIAGLSALDQVQAVKDSLDAAVASGQGFRDWRADVLAGQVPGIGELPGYRLENIFRTNLQTAYARGAGEWQSRNEGTHPYLLYDAVNDTRTRPAHRLMDGTVLPQGHPWWVTHYPPNGFMCRCRAVALTEAQARRLGGVTTVIPDGPAAAPDPGWDGDPRSQPRKGEFDALRRRQSKSALPEKARELAQAAAAPVPDDPDTWRQVGPQMGSNPGGLYEAADGSRYYVKFYPDPKQARSEVATLAIYRAAGIETLEARIIERARPDGRRGIGLATRWRDDLDALPDVVAREDVAEQVADLHQVSALTANWDVFGPDLQNVKLARGSRRLVVIDAGGSMRYRAQGASKPFPDGEVTEIETLRDPRMAPARSAAMFNAALSHDVYAELRAARRVVPRITDEAIADAMEQANFAADDVASVGATLRARRNVLADRYDLEGKYVPAELRAAVEEVQGLATLSRARDGVFERGADFSYRSARGTWQGTMSPTDFAADVTAFEAFLNQTVGPKIGYPPKGDAPAPARLLRSLLQSWSGSSNSNAGALLKLWAFRRFGVAPNHHGDIAASRVEAEVYKQANKILPPRVSLSAALALLDYEYAFNQTLLRRVHGWEPIQLYRRVRLDELRHNLRGDTWYGNAVASATVDPGVFSSVPYRVNLSGWRTENVMKMFQQGSAYMRLQAEREYLLIGRPFALRKPAEDMGSGGTAPKPISPAPKPGP